MSISAISSVGGIQNIYPPQQAPGINTRKDLDALAQALQNGDLQSAQQDFVTLQNDFAARVKNAQSSSSGNTSSSTRPTSIQGDLTGLEQALQSGDLQSAQQAFTKLQTDIATHKTHHHHSHGSKPQSSDNSDQSTVQSQDIDQVISALLQQVGIGDQSVGSSTTYGNAKSGNNTSTLSLIA